MEFYFVYGSMAIPMDMKVPDYHSHHKIMTDETKKTIIFAYFFNK